MTLKNLIVLVRSEYDSADEKSIILLVNELESSISKEILSPAGLEARDTPLSHKKDMDKKILLGEENINIYLYYILSALAMLSGDIEQSNSYTTLFNQKYEEFAARIRKAHIPVKNTKIIGRDII